MEDLRWQIKAAEANLADLRVKLVTAKLDLQSAVARVESELSRPNSSPSAKMPSTRRDYAPDLNVKLAQATADELAKRFDIDKKRLRNLEPVRRGADRVRQQVQHRKTARSVRSEEDSRWNR